MGSHCRAVFLALRGVRFNPVLLLHPAVEMTRIMGAHLDGQAARVAYIHLRTRWAAGRLAGWRARNGAALGRGAPIALVSRTCWVCGGHTAGYMSVSPSLLL
mgnify:FL=1